VIGNPFLAAVHLAYNGHRPISLSPDMLWVLISQTVGRSIEAAADESRRFCVDHPGRLTIETTPLAGALVADGSNEPWHAVLDRVLRQARRYTQPSLDLLVPRFSTTGPIERTAFEIISLASIQPFFRFRLTTTSCGIPAVTLEGEEEDWQTLAHRLEGFRGLVPAERLVRMQSALAKLGAAAGGDVDKEFWRSIYRVGPRGPCRSHDAEGWVLSFLPPRTSARRGSAGRSELASGPVCGLSAVPFRWVERGENGSIRRRRSMELLAGFVGVAQDATLRLRPEIGWAVRQRSESGDETAALAAGSSARE
jgi:hypothetical protein